MYIAKIKFTINKDKLVDFQALATELTKDAQVLPGCCDFQFYRQFERADTCLLYEEWDDKKSFENYKKSPLFVSSSKRLFACINSQPRTVYFEASVDFEK